MVKIIFFIVSMLLTFANPLAAGQTTPAEVLSSTKNLHANPNSKNAHPCKNTNESSRIQEDRRRYEAWCKKHPGQCSKKLKMFN